MAIVAGAFTVTLAVLETDPNVAVTTALKLSFAAVTLKFTDVCMFGNVTAVGNIKRESLDASVTITGPEPDLVMTTEPVTVAPPAIALGMVRLCSVPIFAGGGMFEMKAEGALGNDWP